MAPNALLFDLDGTIWDSFPWYAETLSIETGVPGPTFLEQLQAGAPIVVLMRRHRVPESRLIARAAALRLYPHVQATLTELDAREVPKGIVTSLPGRLAVPLLERLQLSHHFPVIVHAGNCGYRKPDPRPLSTALNRLGIADSGNAVYVGDMASDGKAAKHAGLAFAWAAYGYGGSRPPDVSVILDDFREVLTL